MTVKINGECEESFNGRSAFTDLKDYMVEKYNYLYASDMKLNKKIIKDMVNFLMKSCYKEEDEWMVNWRMRLVVTLMECYARLNAEPETLVTWECDW